MKNEILDLIKNIDKDKFKTFKADNSKELQKTYSVLLFAYLEANLKSIEEIADRIEISIKKGSTTLEKIKQYLEKQEALSKRKLLTFNSFEDFLRYKKNNPEKKFGKSWGNGSQECVYEY